MPHRVHTHPTRLDRESAVTITIDADVVGPLLEDAAHFPVPGGHAPAVAYPRSEGDVAALGRDARSMLPVGALVLGFVNTVVRPLLLLLTLPITLVALSLFYLVVNGLPFRLATWLVPGLDV